MNTRPHASRLLRGKQGRRTQRPHVVASKSSRSRQATPRGLCVRRPCFDLLICSVLHSTTALPVCQLIWDQCGLTSLRRRMSPAAPSLCHAVVSFNLFSLVVTVSLLPGSVHHCSPVTRSLRILIFSLLSVFIALSSDFLFVILLLSFHRGVLSSFVLSFPPCCRSRPLVPRLLSLCLFLPM